MGKFNVLQSLLFVGIVTLLASSAVAQSKTETVVDAIEKMAAAEQVVFTGTAKIPSEEDDGAGGLMIVIAGAGKKQAIYNEQFELSFSPKDESLLICSEKALPGMVIFQQDETIIKRITYLNEGFAINDLASDLPQLFDLDSLKKFVSKAEEAEKKVVDGMESYSYPLSKRLIRDPDGVGAAAIMAPKIKGINATFRIDSKGELAGLVLTVTRENPMAKIMTARNAKINGADLDGMDPAMKAKVQKQLGRSDLVVEYHLTRKNKSAERTQAMMKEMKTLMAE